MADWDDEDRGKRGRRQHPAEDAPRRPRREHPDYDAEWDEPAPRSRRRAAADDDFDHEDERPRRRVAPAYDNEPAPARRGAPRRRETPDARRAPSRRRRGFLRGLVYWGAVASVWCAIGLAGLIGYYAMRLPPIDQLAVPKRPPNIAILAADGTLMANRGETGGSNVAIGDLPKYVPKAFVAIEDRRFYDHFGLDVMGLARAVWRNVSARKVEQGGSTLTQQLAKNLFLTQERSIARKAQEVILSLWLERSYRKDQILELYLNRVYFGSGAYGIEAAAQKYFGKTARLLTVAEASVLAGLMKSPSRLAPNRNPQGATERATLVLREMLEQGHISEQQFKTAMANPAEARRNHGAGSVNYAADWVMDLLSDYVGSIGEDVQVTTTFLMPLQNAAERALTGALEAQGADKNVDQGAMVAMAPDGAVRALVGGLDYADSQFNRAVLARRQPGSAFKPFVYLAALEAGMTPETVREDAPVNIKGWQPENYTREYFGNVTLTRALSMSLNTVAVKLGQEVGSKAMIRTAQKLGINSPLAANASLALGTSEVTPLELTAAYTAFANGGIGVTPYVIRRVKTNSGKLIYERKEANRGRVVEPSIIAQLNLMMRETLINGTARRAELPGWVAAGKTGTTQDHKDAWFVGYTGSLVATVWLGNDDGEPMKKVTGSGLPVEIWSRFMRAAHLGVPPQALPGLAHAAPSAILREAAGEAERASEDRRPREEIPPPREPSAAPLTITPPRAAAPIAQGQPASAPVPPQRPQPVVRREEAPRPAAPARDSERLVPPKPVGVTGSVPPKPAPSFFAGPSEADRDRLNRLFTR